MNLSEINTVTDLLNSQAKQLSPEELLEHQIDSIVDSIDDPAVAQQVALRLIANLGIWHQKMAQSKLESGETEAALLWTSDEAQLKTSFHILNNIEI